MDANPGNGVWEYSLDGGTNWLAIGAVDNSTALLLRDTDRIRLVPNGATNTSASIGIRAWDQTSGTAGTRVNASPVGGTSAFSSLTKSALITVTSINDAPLFVGTDLVSNGTFDTDFSSWTATGNVDISSGDVRFGQVGGVNGVLSQTLSTTIGTTYYVTFDYGERSTTATQSLLFEVNGNVSLVTSGITTGKTENTLLPRVYSFVADSTTTSITFTDTSPSHAGVRGYLDNVVVVPLATPLPTLSYTENDGAVVIDNQISLLDVCNGQVFLEKF